MILRDLTSAIQLNLIKGRQITISNWCKMMCLKVGFNFKVPASNLLLCQFFNYASALASVVYIIFGNGIKTFNLDVAGSNLCRSKSFTNLRLLLIYYFFLFHFVVLLFVVFLLVYLTLFRSFFAC